MRYSVTTFFFLLIAQPTYPAEIPSAWPLHQEIDVERSGLVRQPLPYETADRAHATLRDLRFFDVKGSEVAYLLEYPDRESQQTIPAKQMKVAVQKDRTLMIIELLPPTSDEK